MFWNWLGKKYSKVKKTYPIMHFLLCSRCQSNWPPLFGPLRSVDGKGVFGVIEHRDHDSDLIDKGMEILDRVWVKTVNNRNKEVQYR